MLKYVDIVLYNLPPAKDYEDASSLMIVASDTCKMYP
jgi:hypothetical protein